MEKPTIRVAFAIPLAAWALMAQAAPISFTDRVGQNTYSYSVDEDAFTISFDAASVPYSIRSVTAQNNAVAVTPPEPGVLPPTGETKIFAGTYTLEATSLTINTSALSDLPLSGPNSCCAFIPSVETGRQDSIFLELSYSVQGPTELIEGAETIELFAVTDNWFTRINVEDFPNSAPLEYIEKTFWRYSREGTILVGSIDGEDIRFDYDANIFLDVDGITRASLLADTDVVPIPAAAWLFGSALGVLGWLRRRNAV